jgi:hypothetical protein
VTAAQVRQVLNGHVRRSAVAVTLES